jgi:WD40 repeat protein
VAGLSRFLESQGLSTFLDRKDLVPGLPWPAALEQALAGAGAVAVFLGASGLGSWQKREMWFALDRQAQAEREGKTFPVIPILLPEGNPSPGFLSLNTWIDLRDDPTDPERLESLVRAVQAEAPEATPEALPSICPYRGLEPFGEEESAFFCGREAFSDRLLQAVLRDPFVAVVGPSGSGKSSVVHAGLLPLLRRQRPPAQAWDAVSFTPGERPYHRLAAALLPLLEPELSEVSRLAEVEKLGEMLKAGTVPLEEALRRVLEKSKGTGRLLLVADQFEELFTLTPEAIRRSFAEALLAVTGKVPVTLVLTLRADFYDRALSLSRELSDRLETALVNFGPMRRDELERAITEPARRAQLNFEPGLAKRILDAVGDEPGNLPLLEFALTELWNRRSERQLTHAGYSDSGEVEGAIARRAETEFERLTSEQREVARRVFIGLVRVSLSEEGSRDTRKRTPLVNLDEPARRVVDRLAGSEARLLVTSRDEKGEGVVEVTHEALIGNWQRLQGWLKEDREFLLWRERLQVYLAEFERNGDLLSGASLTEAGRWLRERRRELGGEEIALIDASLTARNMAQRRRRRLTQVGVGAAVLVGILGVVALWFGLKATRQAQEARVGSILATQYAIRDPAVLALLALELDKLPAGRAKESLEAVRFASRAAMSALPVTIFRLRKEWASGAAFNRNGTHFVVIYHDEVVQLWNIDGYVMDLCQSNAVESSGIWTRVVESPMPSVDFSPDGTRVVTVCAGVAQIWNTSERNKPSALYKEQSLISRAIFSPDGSRVAIASADGALWIQNADLSGKAVFLGNHEEMESNLAFSPDGSSILTVGDDGALAKLWNIKKGTVKTFRSSIGLEDEVVVKYIFDPGGSRILTASDKGMVRVWNIASIGGPILSGKVVDGLLDIVFNPDGSRLLVFSKYGVALTLNSDGSGKVSVIFKYEGEVLSAGFSSDGSRVLAFFSGAPARIWSTEGLGQLAFSLDQDEDSASYGTFSMDGYRVLTISGHAARIWNVNPEEPVVLQGSADELLNVVFSPEGSRILAGSSSGAAWVWTVDGSRKPVVFPKAQGKLLSASFNSKGSHVLIIPSKGAPQVWKADGSGEAIVIGKNNNTIRTAAFSPDGFRVLTTPFYEEGPVRIWNVDRSRDVFDIGDPGDSAFSAVFNADGTRIVSCAVGGLRIWNSSGLGRPTLVREIVDWAPGYAVFSPDESLILVVSFMGLDAQIRRADGTGKPIEIRGHIGNIYRTTFSPNGSLILTEAFDGTVQVLQADGSGALVVTQGHEELIRSTNSRGMLQRGASFSPDSSRIVTPSKNWTAQIWNVDGFGQPVVLAGHKGKVWGAAFSPDGSRVATASADGTVRVWRVTWDSLIDYLRQSIKACLTSEQRMKYLGETPSDAREASEDCERELRSPH